MCVFASPKEMVPESRAPLNPEHHVMLARSFGMYLEGNSPTRNIGLHGSLGIVIKKQTSTLVAVAVLLTVLGHNAKAQQNTESCTLYNQLVERYGFSCLYNWTFDDLPDPNAPPTMVCCNPLGVPWGQVCAAPRPSCGVPPGA